MLGLGPTQLGPLFPDQTSLHHPGLRHRAQALLQSMGRPLHSGIAACLPGPNLATPSELRWLEQTPADLAIQDVAGPWIAAAHAGMGMLALSMVCGTSGDNASMQAVLTTMQRNAPWLDDLIVGLADDLRTVAAELRSEV